MPKATPEQIAQWKGLHGFVHEIHIPKDESRGIEEKYCYLKPPDRKVVAQAQALQHVPVRSNEALLKGCWIDGDADIKENDKYFMIAQGMLMGLMDYGDAEFAKY